MIKSSFNIKKLIRLYLEIKFYKLVIYFVFVCMGYETFSTEIVTNRLFSVLYSIGYGRSFPEVFLLLYMLSPYINKLALNLSKKEYGRLILILLAYFTGLSTVFISLDTINYIGWFITVYMIGAYIRLFPHKFTESKNFGKYGSWIIFYLSVASILIIDTLRYKQIFNIKNFYYWVNDSHKPFAILLAIFLFIYFKNLSIYYNKYINLLGSSTFGILLIHANSDAMRKFLWSDFLKNGTFYYSPYFIIHALVSVLAVFIVCFFLEQLRTKFFSFCQRMFFKGEQ